MNPCVVYAVEQDQKTCGGGAIKPCGAGLPTVSSAAKRHHLVGGLGLAGEERKHGFEPVQWDRESADQTGADASGDIARIVIANDVGGESEGQEEESHLFKPCSGLA